MEAQLIFSAEDIRPATEAYLSGFLDKRQLPTNLDEAVRYALLGPGKRIRPTLAVLACQGVGGPGRLALPGACAVEMIHAFSLVHDDLPPLDNDELRRGRPTAHIAFGEALALLAGDALMSVAFEIAGQAPDPARTVRELAGASTDMIAGQVLDTLGGGATDRDWEEGSSLDRLRRIHRAKTGALIRASCRIGAISAGAGDDTDQLRALTDYASSVGLMFQVVDDLLDVEQDPDHVGKATGKDKEAGKLTYPGLMGTEQARDEVRLLKESALRALEPLGTKADPLRRLCEDLAIRTK